MRKGLVVLQVIVVSALLVFSWGFGWAQDLVRPGDQHAGATLVTWNYTADATGAASARIAPNVCGKLELVHHIPDSTAPASGGTWQLTMNRGFGYEPQWYSTDLFTCEAWPSGIGGGPTTATLEVWDYNTATLTVGSHLKLSLTGATKAGGGGASGRWVLVFGAL